MAKHARFVDFANTQIPILAPEHLIVCKVIFGRPKDWVDIEEIVAWGTPIDETSVLDSVDELLGTDSEPRTRLAGLLGQEA